MENPIKKDDLGVTLFLETPILKNTYCILPNGVEIFGDLP